jgi:hypothetical protein
VKKARLFIVGVSALTLWGCGGGSGTSGTAANPLASGRQALTQLASNTTPTSTESLQSALTLFLQALQKDPHSSEAHFGAAVCLMGAAAQQIDGVDVGIATLPPGMVAVSSKSAVGLASRASGNGGASHGNSGAAFVLPTPPTSGDLPPAPSGAEGARPIEPTHTLGLFWFLDRGLSNPNTLLNMLAPISDLRLGLIPYYGYSGDAEDVARRQKLLADLATVADHLQIVEADANFTLTLPAPDQDGQTATIGLPEVYLFDAYVQSLRVSTALSLTYNRDPGASTLFPPVVSGGAGSGGSTGSGGTTGAPSPPTPPIFTGHSREPGDGVTPNSPYLALDTNHDGKLSPDEYLPSSPFLTLRDAAYFQTAQAAMLTIADRETKGIAGVLARSADGNFLIPNSTDVQNALTNIRDKVLPLIRQAATGPVTLAVPRYQIIPLIVGGSGLATPATVPNALFTLRPVSAPTALIYPPVEIPTEPLTFNIAAWFAHPPADLKPLAPTYVLDSIGYPNFKLTTYPDLTFAGLYPNGLPEDLRF